MRGVQEHSGRRDHDCGRDLRRLGERRAGSGGERARSRGGLSPEFSVVDQRLEHAVELRSRWTLVELRPPLTVRHQAGRVPGPRRAPPRPIVGSEHWPCRVQRLLAGPVQGRIAHPGRGHRLVDGERSGVRRRCSLTRSTRPDSMGRRRSRPSTGWTRGSRWCRVTSRRGHPGCTRLRGRASGSESPSDGRARTSPGIAAQPHRSTVTLRSRARSFLAISGRVDIGRWAGRVGCSGGDSECSRSP